MNSNTRKKGWSIFASLALYVVFVGLYAIWSNNETKGELYREIDQRLTIAATGLKYLLADDFHDRALDAESIAKNEEMKNRAAVSRFNDAAGFKYLYTLVHKDGRFFFSAPTVTEEEARERERWYFYPYEDVPEGFVRAYKEKTTVFIEYTDQWGTFRSIAKPETSPGGRLYLACADYDISYVQGILRANMYRSLAVALAFLLVSAPFILSFRSMYRSFTKELEAVNRDLAAHRDHLEVMVEERTAELKAAKDHSDKLVVDLEKALNEVKTLEGILPICSHCKKIRDESGRWHLMEEYIPEHSEAMVSHGLCPECADALYPKYARKNPNQT